MAQVQPVKVNVVFDETRPAGGVRVDENGCVVLSERDVDRIATAVAAKLTPNAKAAAEQDRPVDYFPRKSRPRFDPVTDY